MGLRKEMMFFIVVVSLVIFEFCSTMNIVFASEESFTSASGYNKTNDDEKGADEIGNNAIFGGNVGIGTMNPLAKLHIFGSPGVDGILFPDGTLQTTAAIEGLVDTYWKAENSVIYNTNDGNVGIGTIAPTTALEVADIIYSNNGGFKFPDGSVQTSAFNTDDINGMLSTGTFGSGNIPIEGSGTRMMWYPRKAAFIYSTKH